MSNQPIDKIATGSYYLIFDQVITYGLGALFWILLAKIVSTTLIGETMVVVALTMVVLGFTGLGAEVTISKYVSEYNSQNNPNASKKAFIFGIKTGLGVSVGVGLLLAILSGPLSTAFYHDPKLAALMIVAMLTYLPFETLLSCFFGALQGSHKMQYIAITHLIFQGGRISAVMALIVVNFGYLSIIISFAIGDLLALVGAYLFFVRRLFAKSITSIPSTQLPGIRAFSGFNYLATGISTLAIQLNYILLGQQNFSSVALFGISYLISGVVGIIVLAFGKAILPTATSQQRSNDTTKLNSAISLALKVAITLSGFIYILLIVDPGLLLSSLSHEYLAASSALQLLVVSAVLGSLALFMIYLLNAVNRPEWVARIAIISSVCIIASSISLVPRYGIEGAAVSSLIGSSVSLGLAAWLSKRSGINISYRDIYRPVSAVTVAIFVALVVIYSGIAPPLASAAIAVTCYVSLIAAFKLTSREELRQMVGIAAHATGLSSKR